MNFCHALLVWNHTGDFKSNAAAQSFDSDVTRMISEQSLLHPVQLPCSTGIQHFFFSVSINKGVLNYYRKGQWIILINFFIYDYNICTYLTHIYTLFESKKSKLMEKKRKITFIRFSFEIKCQYLNEFFKLPVCHLNFKCLCHCLLHLGKIS